MLTISIILEVEVAIIAVLAARRGNPYIYGLAFTFGAYVLYDLGVSSNVQGGLLSGLFLFATITALIAVWGLYRNRSTKKPGGSQAMSKLAWIVVFATLTAAPAAAQQGASRTFAVPGRAKVNRSSSGQATRIMLRPPRPSRGSTASRSR